jgi:hypothetical protein
MKSTPPPPPGANHGTPPRATPIGKPLKSMIPEGAKETRHIEFGDSDSSWTDYSAPGFKDIHVHDVQGADAPSEGTVVSLTYDDGRRVADFADSLSSPIDYVRETGPNGEFFNAGDTDHDGKADWWSKTKSALND